MRIINPQKKVPCLRSMRVIPAAIMFGLVIALITMSCSADRGDTSECTVVARACDNTGRSTLNQTFAFLGVSQPNFVQLYSYWGGSKGCLSEAPVANTTGVALSWPLCAQKDSVWSYGPGSILTYVYYKNLASGNCLTLNVSKTDPAGASGLYTAPCCSETKNCTSTQSQQQSWVEPSVKTDPYNRILSQFTVSKISFCLTRIGDSC